MFHQVKVEVLGLIENMSQMKMPDGSLLDVFGAGGTERTAAQFGLAFLGAVDLDPKVRKGGDTGMPVALAGRGSELGGAFYEVADKVVAAADKISNEDVLEIS
jgi:ATP-binding protein involved in chromosome partitioning